jgi:hypothetical protein
VLPPQHDERTQTSFKVNPLHGVSLAVTCTLLTPAAGQHHVDSSSEFAVLVQYKLGNHSVLMAAEVDCAKQEGDGPIGGQPYVELKTYKWVLSRLLMHTLLFSARLLYTSRQVAHLQHARPREQQAWSICNILRICVSVRLPTFSTYDNYSSRYTCSCSSAPDNAYQPTMLKVSQAKHVMLSTTLLAHAVRPAGFQLMARQLACCTGTSTPRGGCSHSWQVWQRWCWEGATMWASCKR